MNGYHEFYRATLLHKGIALHIVSLWNTIILAIQTLMQDQYGPTFFAHCPKSFFSPTTYVVLFSAFETVILLLSHGWYVLRVRRFNAATPAPDAFRGLSDNMNSVSFWRSPWCGKIFPTRNDKENINHKHCFTLSDWCCDKRC